MRYFFGFVIFVIVMTALVGALFYLLDQKPESQFSALLVKHKEIGGPILGALITVIAAGLAFTSVQLQLRAQWRGVHVSELTYWQQRLDTGETVISGIAFIKDITDRVQKIASAVDNSQQYPYVDRLRALQPTGVLDVNSTPPSGSNLISFDLNLQIIILRNNWFAIQDATKIAAADGQVKEALLKISAIAGKLDATAAAQRKNVERALVALRQLEAESE
ncbi:hypothetical protein [Tardiphaga sp. 841_E9_N1_2]|jgi:hypothetical protein|uniref:hypothetical protein n=1 Tax=Tardiphaga sp. 841_E9_N1_2 TaxID=3240762 RepID=UPI003F1F784F